MGERLARGAPTEPKHLIRLYQMMHDKTMPTDEYGRPKLTEDDLKIMPKEMRDWATENWKKLPKASSIGTFEKIAYGLGFPTVKMSKYQEGVYAIKGVAREVRTEKAGMNREVGKIIAGAVKPGAASGSSRPSPSSSKTTSTRSSRGSIRKTGTGSGPSQKRPGERSMIWIGVPC